MSGYGHSFHRSAVPLPQEGGKDATPPNPLNSCGFEHIAQKIGEGCVILPIDGIKYPWYNVSNIMVNLYGNNKYMGN